VKKFLDWAHTRGRCTLAAMTREDLVDYQQWVLLTDLSPTQRGMHRRAARLFWVFRDALHTDRLTVDPQRLHAWAPRQQPSPPPYRERHRSDSRGSDQPPAGVGVAVGQRLQRRHPR